MVFRWSKFQIWPKIENFQSEVGAQGNAAPVFFSFEKKQTFIIWDLVVTSGAFQIRICAKLRKVAIFQSTHFGPNFELRIWGWSERGEILAKKTYDVTLFSKKNLWVQLQKLT